jgi:cation diffusion facilitator CzcD-associated flavoprotein CzcO
MTKDGTHHDVDVIVFATGFQVTDVSGLHRVIGREGQELHDVWKASGLESFYGTFVHGFPNYFALLGPNSGLGSNSMIYILECQVNMIIRLVKASEKKGGAASGHTIEVRRDVQDAFNSRIQSCLKKSIWLSGCNSWYLAEGGKNTTLWPYTTMRFWWETSRVGIQNFVTSK